MDTVRIISKNVKMVAHRGLSGIERENTNPAFVAAGNRSYFGIETDVHRTADGKFVIIHDETTERVSLGKVNINVEESNYADLENIVLPDLDESTNRQDIRIPLLEDYIKICKKYDKVCVLELKNPFVKEDIVKMVEEIRSLGYLEKVIFISFSWANCVILRSLLPDNDIQWLTGVELTDEVINDLVDERLNLDAYYKLLTKELVDKLHSRGISINCWTCDIKEDGENLVDMGVDFITSNILE
ncbi:MAG: hypothetical protein IJ460_04315 [Clostridia bacterium]|nr:hypothetical protein [Clostridia bacterium]